jgi:hypothetical protein
MKKIIHTVELPNGKTAKRESTGRRYTHVVIARETELSRTESVTMHEKQAVVYRALADDRRSHESREASHREHVERMRKWSPDYELKSTTFEEWQAEQLKSAARHEEQAVAHRARPLGDWHAASWSGRSDLAAKAAIQEIRNGRFETRVLPVGNVREHEVKSRTVAQETPAMSEEARALFDRLAAPHGTISPDGLAGFEELVGLKLAEVNRWSKSVGITRHGYNIVKSERGVASGKLVAKTATAKGADLREQAADFARSAGVED